MVAAKRSIHLLQYVICRSVYSLFLTLKSQYSLFAYYSIKNKNKFKQQVNQIELWCFIRIQKLVAYDHLQVHIFSNINSYWDKSVLKLNWWVYSWYYQIYSSEPLFLFFIVLLYLNRFCYLTLNLEFVLVLFQSKII